MYKFLLPLGRGRELNQHCDHQTFSSSQPDEMDRMFPTFSFSFVVASILVAELALKFHFRLVAPEDGAAVGSRDPAAADSDALDDDELAPPTELGFGGCGRADAPKNFKMLTTPLEEIWVTVTPRN